MELIHTFPRLLNMLKLLHSLDGDISEVKPEPLDDEPEEILSS